MPQFCMVFQSRMVLSADYNPISYSTITLYARSLLFLESEVGAIGPVYPRKFEQNSSQKVGSSMWSIILLFRVRRASFLTADGNSGWQFSVSRCSLYFAIRKST